MRGRGEKGGRVDQEGSEATGRAEEWAVEGKEEDRPFGEVSVGRKLCEGAGEAVGRVGVGLILFYQNYLMLL